MINFLTSIINEIKSYFVFEPLTYEIVGKCRKCGKCCTHMYSLDSCSEKDFKLMQYIYPSYRNFYIKGKDESGNLIFACKHVSPEGLCLIYNKRPAMCKRYPVAKIKYPADLHDGCGYSIVKKKFSDYLK